MWGFVLALAISNLALGYVAAAALMEPPLWSGWSERLRRHALRAAESRLSSLPGPVRQWVGPSVVPSLASVGEGGRPTVAGLDELPAGWLVQLASEGIVAETFVEATAHVLRLDVSRYREQLIAAETRARLAGAQRDAAMISRLADELRSLNGQWLDSQTSVADMLGQHGGRLGDHEHAASALEQALLDQAAQIGTACTLLESLSTVPDVENRSRQLIEQIVALLANVHGLRDRIADLLATLIRAGKAMHSLPESVQQDPATSKNNRIGLETLLAGWWLEDAERSRPLSAILVDVDRFGRMNHRLSTRVGDIVLVALAELIDEDVVKDSGFERLTRIAGDKFLILQGDIGPHQALTNAERLRQTIEASTYEGHGAEFELTISCGVIEVGHSESSLDLVRRAYETMRFAKKAGRNRCALDKGDGPMMLDPPHFPVKARTISLPA